MPKKLSIDIVKRRLLKTHGDEIELDVTTYIDTRTKCRFIDKDYGEFWSIPDCVINQGKSCLKRKSEKFKKTNMERYGVENPAMCKEVKQKIINTNMERYGTHCALCNVKIKDSAARTLKERYGVDNPSKSGIIKERKRQTSLRNFGVSNNLKSIEIQHTIKQTNIEKYGVEYPIQNKDIASKQAKSSNNSFVLYHWKTNEELICVGSYEVKVINYLNENQVEYSWQPKVFKMPTDGGKTKTYRPDLYLDDGQLWVEIKGYFRKDAQDKWDWFHSAYKNSELWNKNKLKELNIL